MGDGLYGLCGAAIHTDHAGGRAWGEYTAKASRIDVAYLAQPRGGSFDVYVDGARAGHVATRAATAASAWRPFAVGDGAHRVEVVASGDGDVRLFGANLDRTQVGVTYDALGINGARITNALAWDETHIAEQIRHRDPDLVVLAYGTNESGDTDVPIDAYERELVDLLGRIARAAPSASCMLLGPPDRAIHTREGWGPSRASSTSSQPSVASRTPPGARSSTSSRPWAARGRSPCGPRNRSRARRRIAFISRAKGTLSSGTPSPPT